MKVFVSYAYKSRFHSGLGRCVCTVEVPSGESLSLEELIFELEAEIARDIRARKVVVLSYNVQPEVKSSES